MSKSELKIHQTVHVVSIGSTTYEVTPDNYNIVSQRLSVGDYKGALNRIGDSSPKVTLRLSERATLGETRGTGEIFTGFETRTENGVQVTSTKAAARSGSNGSASVNVLEGGGNVSQAAVAYAENRALREPDAKGHIFKSLKTIIFGDEDAKRITGNRHSPPSRQEHNTLQNARHIDQDRHDGQRALKADTEHHTEVGGYDVDWQSDHSPSAEQVFDSQYNGPTSGGGWRQPYDAGPLSSGSTISFGIDPDVAQEALDTGKSIGEVMASNASSGSIQVNGKYR